jgi:hypothetical protein
MPLSRLRCPPLKDIYCSLKGKYSRRRRARLINHISHCCFCADDFDVLRTIFHIEKDTLNEIAQIVQKRKDGHIIVEENINVYRQMNGHMQIYVRRALSISLALLAVAFVVIGLFTDRQSLKRFLFFDQDRSPQKNEIYLLYPTCDMEHKISTVIFKWISLPKADYYTIEIYDETLLPIWKSFPIFEPFFRLPANMPKAIRPQKKYFWTVTAYKSNKMLFESKISCFYLK